MSDRPLGNKKILRKGAAIKCTRGKASRQSIRSMPQVTRSVEHAGRKPFVTATELFQLVHIMQGNECNALFRYNRRFDVLRYNRRSDVLRYNRRSDVLRYNRRSDVLRYNRRSDAPPTGDDLIVRLHDHRILRWASPPCRTLRWASPPSRILRWASPPCRILRWLRLHDHAFGVNLGRGLPARGCYVRVGVGSAVSSRLLLSG